MRRFFLLVILAALAGAAYLLLAPAGPTHETFVDFPPGTSVRQMGALLEEHGIIRSRYAFQVVRLAERGTLKAGEYRFDHPATVLEVYDRLRRGDVFTRSVTIPEGANMFDVAERLEAAQLGPKELFLQAANRDVQLVADLDPDAPTLEGYLFPDTYHLPRKATPDQIAAAMVKRFRAAAASMGLTRNFHQVVTLASIVEKETPLESERPLVASVMVNRLEKRMPLMTDPSVIYAQLREGRYRGTIYQSDLAYDSPYNTYRHAGLPPGPIANPGVASLKAAMSPAATNYLYFVAASGDPSGHSRFAATLEEHTQNVQAYRKTLHNGSR
ncbi:MAG TPA: endolytic transglycosylase MltG [Acidisarcina sp.]|nr:endolytic transglycosylase MltG [Acidisarcina sp.]